MIQLFVHGVYNTQTTNILPTDGCGQILDTALDLRMTNLVWLSVFISVIFSVLLATAKRGPMWKWSLTCVTILSTMGFLIFGWINWEHHDFLTSCDIFFLGDTAAFSNGSTAILVAITGIYQIRLLRN